MKKYFNNLWLRLKPIIFNKASMLMLLTAFLSLNTFGQIPEKMYLKFNATGTTVPNESPISTSISPSGTINTGATQGGTGQFGGGLIGGGGTSAAVDAGAPLNLTGPWTISFYSNGIPSSTTILYLFGTSGATASTGFRCFTGGAAGAGGLTLRGATNLTNINLTNVFNGSPTVIHFVYDGSSSVKVYKDGALFATSTQPATVATNTGALNFLLYPGGLPTGYITDEFRIYNRELSATEITDTWNKDLSVSGAPNNASVTGLISPTTFCPNTLQDIKVKIKNSGSNVINNVTVQWSIDGLAQTPIFWNSPLDTLGGLLGPNDTIISLGSIFFGNTGKTIKVWTEYPNSVADTVNIDDTIQVIARPSLSGPYTIGGTNPDYTSIDAAVSDLNTYGVCTNVTFNVAQNSGPYTTNLSFKEIPGASSSATITFNGNGNTISSATSPVISFVGSSYVTLDSFNITQTGTLGFGVQINGGSHHLTLNKNTITVPVTTASTTCAMVVAAGAYTAAGNNAQYLTITNNTLVNGYASLTLTGNTGYADNYGHYIANNTFKDFYTYGVYVANGDSVQIENNDINRATRASVTTLYGIYLNGSRYVKAQKNRIHDTKGSTNYPFYITNTVNSPGYETEISNNAIYNLGNTGTMYGIYCLTTATTGVNIYHNTIQHEYTSGTHRGIHFSVAPNNVNLKNNIIRITGGGTKHAIYVTTTSTSFTSDNNVLHVSGGGTNTVGYWTAARTTLADWQNNSGQDINSVIDDPAFTNLTTGNLLHTAAAVNNIGTPVGVSTDINGTARSSSKPDPGAYESRSMSYNNAGISSLVAPVNFCGGMNAIKVRLSNNGNNTLNNVTIQWSMNGVLQPSINWFSPLDTFGGTLPSDTVVTLGSIFFTGKKQILKAWTEYPNSVNDTINIDDTLSIDVSPIMNGTYIIGGVNADFANIGEALTALKARGVCAPVILNNTSNDTSNYTTTLTFENISGLSDINTLTFNGNGHTLMSSATPILDFNGMSYITIDSFTITGNSSSYVGVGIRVGGASHHLTFNRNIVSVSTTSTTTTSNSAFSASNSLTSATTAGNNAQYLTITNNTFIGGYYQFTLMGNAGQLDNYGHYVANNTFSDFYAYGAYLANADSAVVLNNDINRATRASVTTLYGIYLNGSRYVKAQKNRIHDTKGATNYPFYISNCVNSPGYETELSNNVIYNLGNTGTVYGMYFLTTATTNVNVFHNTIQHDVASGTGVIRGAFFNVALTNVNFKNNIISITGAGTGIKTGIYVTIPSTSFTSNNNLLHVSTSGTNTDNFGYWGVANPTQNDWFAASGQDLLSKDITPDFTNLAMGNLKPLSVPIDNMGAPVGITTDITGATRSATTPDVGAYEFTTAFSCTGKPYAGNAVATTKYACPGTPFNLSVDNDSIALGLKYQWLSSSTQNGTYLLTGDTLRTIAGKTQLSTTWYKLIVTCPGSGLSDTADEVRVRSTNVPFNGLYTINKNQPASATNYTNFIDLVDELNCNGVTGPVTITVAPNSGPYEGNFTFDSIPGASATNTITFTGTGDSIISGLSPVIGFNKSSYITFDSLSIVGDAGFTGFAVHITNQSHHLTFNRNVIDAGITATGTASGGIIASGSPTVGSTAGNNAQYLTITNNHISGGYFSISLTGNTSYLDNYGHTISNNKLHDYYVYGVYMVNGDSNVIHGNDFSRPTRPTLTTFYALYGSSVRNLKVRNNRIHDAGTGTYTAYPVYITTSVNTLGYETEFINNAIYNIPTTGTIYGYYLLGTRDRLKFYHNTVALETQAANTVRGLYMSTAPNNHDFKNNILSITGTGTGTKHLMYVGATSTSITSDRNVLYIDTTITTNYTGYLTADIKSLQAWKQTTLVDANSVGFNPVFANPTTGDLSPLSINCDNLGTNVGVTTDITGAARSTTTPDIGAFEFTGIAGDIALTDGRLSRASACYSNADSAFITINNIIGSAVDFSINPLTIMWNVTGPVNSNGSILISSGTLAPTASATYSTNLVDRSLPGEYTFNAYILPNAINNSTSNDTLIAVSSGIQPILSVATKTYNVNSPTDSVSIQALSPLFPGGAFIITEICHNKNTVGPPVGGWPSWHVVDDYIEISGVPNSDLGGYTLEQWDATTLVSTHTFPAGTFLSPSGTAIIAVGTVGTATNNPANFFYLGNGGYTGSFDSGLNPTGRILKNSSGTIVDAVTYSGNSTYSFPAAAGVSASDWSGVQPVSNGTCGLRLIGPDVNSISNWIVVTNAQPQDPNTFNTGVPAVNPVALTGFNWSYNGSSFSTSPRTVVGPYTVPGTYTYIASYTNACGTFYDTVFVIAGQGVPVKLASFDAKTNGNDVLVSWQTASEKNVSHFEVYKSFDNKNWTLVNEMKAAGNSNKTINYRTVDADAMNTLSAMIYYKLKSVDNDGTAEWSKEAVVNVNNKPTAIAVYPNPFNATVKLSLPENGNANVTITSLHGETVLSQTIIAENSAATIKGLDNLKPGVYFIKVTQNGVTHAEKLVKN